MDLVNSRQVDIGYLALDPERAKEVDFSAPYALMANTYVVRRDAPFQSVAEVDRAGVKVGAVKGQSQQLFLSSHLKNAQVRVFPVMPSLEELERLIAGGEIDAFGANRQRMVDAAARFPSLRALPDNFSSVGQAIVLPKGERAKMDEINRFIYSVIESGLVKSSLERANNAGVLAAPGRK
jgi:polar amino acid transport system substrate-binding protein